MPYLFLLWIGDIVLTFAVKWVFTGHLSTGASDTTLLSHQIRMGIRIVIAFVMSGALFTFVKCGTTKDLVLTGALGEDAISCVCTGIISLPSETLAGSVSTRIMRHNLCG